MSNTGRSVDDDFEALCREEEMASLTGSYSNQTTARAQARPPAVRAAVQFYFYLEGSPLRMPSILSANVTSDPVEDR